MVFKKVIGAALIPLACISLFSCNRSDVETTVNSDINLETAAAEGPFMVGYYIGDEHTLQLIYMGNETEHSYGVSIVDNDTGVEDFFGLVYNVSDRAMSLTVPGYNNQAAMLSVDLLIHEKKGYNIRVIDMSDDGISAALCGEYEYSGDTWYPQSAQNADVINAGIYIRDEYILAVDHEDGKMSFTISDSDGEVLFEGSRGVNEEQNTVMIRKGENIYRFAKCYNANDGEYIEVSIIGYYTDCDYLGNFKLAS